MVLLGVSVYVVLLSLIFGALCITEYLYLSRIHHFILSYLVFELGKSLMSLGIIVEVSVS
jgi:hypothetical protein